MEAQEQKPAVVYIDVGQPRAAIAVQLARALLDAQSVEIDMDAVDDGQALMREVAAHMSAEGHHALAQALDARQQLLFDDPEVIAKRYMAEAGWYGEGNRKERRAADARLRKSRRWKGRI